MCLPYFNLILLLQIDAALIARQADTVEKSQPSKLDIFSKRFSSLKHPSSLLAHKYTSSKMASRINSLTKQDGNLSESSNKHLRRDEIDIADKVSLSIRMRTGI